MELFLPLGAVTVIVAIVVWFTKFKSQVTNSLDVIRDNHLTHVQANTEKMCEIGERQIETLIRIETKLDGLL